LRSTSKLSFSYNFVYYVYITVAIHHSSAYIYRSNKRYYDTWDTNGDVSSNGNDDSAKIFPFRQKGYNKDLCANKPLWYLKYQARLGKLSPFYDCLSVHGI
jgi:hypothetical protein